MSDKHTTKRSTRITFVGCCNLPPQKAIQLRDSLQTVISHLSNIHAACDDARIEVHEKHKTIRDMASLSKEVEVILSVGKDQLDLCQGEQDIHAQLQGVYRLMQDSRDKASVAFKRIGDAQLQKGVEKDAANLVDYLLALVRDTVELLRIADKYTIRRAENVTNDLYLLAQDVLQVPRDQLESELAVPFEKTTEWVVKVIGQRADTIDEPVVKNKLVHAAAAVANHAPAVLAAARGDKRQADSHLNALHTATQDITRALGTAPEFAVMFDVDYIDSEFAAKLAALSASVRAADPINVAKHSKAIGAEVEKRVKAAAADKSPAVQEKCKQATDACGVVMKHATHALQVRTETKSPQSPPYIAAESQLHSACAALQQAVNALPASTHKKTSTHLIKAAQDLSSKLHQLFVS